MNTHAGYSKKTLTNTNVLLAGGGDKSLADFLGGIQYVSASHKIQYRAADTNAWSDLVTLIVTDENVKQTPKTDNVNRPLMMINGGTSAGELTSTSMFSTGIYANASTKMITSSGYVKTSSDDTYVLLGGGGHKALSDFATSGHTHTINGTFWGNSWSNGGNISGAMTFSSLAMATNYTDVWSDGTNSHPWYGYDHRYDNTGVYSTTITDFFGITIKTASGNISMNNGGNVGIGTFSPNTKLHISGGKILINPPAEFWTTVLEGYCSSLGAGQAIAITIGKTNSQYNACALQYHHVGDGSSSNYIALSMYDANRLLTVNAAGNVGIGTGTTAPSYKLHVNGDIGTSGNITISHATSATMTDASTNPKITFSEGGVLPVHLTYTDYDSYRSPAGLKVVGGTDATPAWFEAEGDMYARHYYESSDIRLKHNISMISKSIRKFRFNNDNKLYYGFIAQELEELHPELVDNSGEYKTVNYNSAICYYIAELENRVKELEDKLKKYEEMLIKKD